MVPENDDRQKEWHVTTILEQHRYFDAAAQAVRYVFSRMDIGPSNKFPISYSGWPARTLCVAHSRARIRTDLEQQAPLVKRSGADPMKAMVDAFSYWAKEMGCGNCGEQSAMAFVYLRDIARVFPLDWMQIGDFAHAFVVLGRYSETCESDVTDWNSEAVICDPYQRESGPASSSLRLRGAKIVSLYRLEP
jgi:hypothetical protein